MYLTKLKRKELEKALQLQVDVNPFRVASIMTRPIPSIANKTDKGIMKKFAFASKLPKFAFFPCLFCPPFQSFPPQS